MASAVPHEPAPRTAIRSALMRLPAGRGLRRGDRSAIAGAVLDRLRVERVEVDGLEQQLREAALADEVRDRFTRERVERVRTEAADEHGMLLGRVPLDLENPGL